LKESRKWNEESRRRSIRREKWRSSSVRRSKSWLKSGNRKKFVSNKSRFSGNLTMICSSDH
jgi:hypothetical protein